MLLSKNASGKKIIDNEITVRKEALLSNNISKSEFSITWVKSQGRGAKPRNVQAQFQTSNCDCIFSDFFF